MTIDERLDRIEALLKSLAERERVKDFYTTDEIARLVGKREFTVREWARLGRIHAQKRRSGRGAFASWAISHQELLRYQREGLLPEISRTHP
jgi:Helix-turn-helix domain